MKTFNYEIDKITEYCLNLDTYDDRENYLKYLLDKADIDAPKNKWVRGELNVLVKIEYLLDKVRFSPTRLAEEIKKIEKVGNKVSLIESRRLDLESRLPFISMKLETEKNSTDRVRTNKMERHLNDLSNYLDEIYKMLNFWLDCFNHTDPDDFAKNEMIKSEKPSIKTDRKIRWLGTETQLIFLFDQLAKKDYLESDFLITNENGYKRITNIFDIKERENCDNKTNSKIARDEKIIVAEKIRWFGSDVQFVYLFDQLAKQHYIPKNFTSVTGRGYKILADRFINQKGDMFKNVQLPISYGTIHPAKKGQRKNLEELDSILSNMAKNQKQL